MFLEGAEDGALFVQTLRTVPGKRRIDLTTGTLGLSISDGTKRGTRPIPGIELEGFDGGEEQAWQVGRVKDAFAPFAVDGFVYFRNPEPGGR